MLCFSCIISWRISIHAAREGGDAAKAVSAARKQISIHAAREGGDVANSVPPVTASRFQSTPPVKAATLPRLSATVCRQYFNPRRP